MRGAKPKREPKRWQLFGVRVGVGILHDSALFWGVGVEVFRFREMENGGAIEGAIEGA